MDPSNEGRILEKLDRMHVDIGKIEQHLGELNGRVGKDEIRLAVIENWRASIEVWCREHDGAEKKTVERVTDLRIEMAKMAAMGGGLGLVITIVAAVLKALGVL